jgi:tripartite-type tricarboxylate transporter receptor subunit TctC
MNARTIAPSAAVVLFAVLFTVASRADDAANYPSQSIEIIVPFPAGSTADTVPRVVAEKL